VAIWKLLYKYKYVTGRVGREREREKNNYSTNKTQNKETSGKEKYINALSLKLNFKSLLALT